MNSGEPQTAAKVIFGKYELLRLLGCGSSAKVYLSCHLPSGLRYAIKAFSKPRPPSSSSSTSSPISTAVIREISALRRLRHRHILRLHEVLASRSKIYLVLELASGGALFSLLASRGRLPENQSRRLFRQLISAVAYSHSCGISHRDLKPENLLLDDAGDLKVSDFGLSSIDDPEGCRRFLLNTLCGTPAYLAPEIVSKKCYDGLKVDIWSCGVVLFVLTAGYLPFNETSLVEMYRKIHRGEFKCPRWTSPELRRLLAGLLDPEPETRTSVEGILRDPWFEMGGFDSKELTAMMRLSDDPDEEMDGSNDATWPSSKLGPDSGRELDAFDIISFSSGLDLSGLFEPDSDQYRFVSTEPVPILLDRIEELGREEGLVVRRKRGKGFGAIMERKNGDLVVRIDVHPLKYGSAAMVAAVKGNGAGVESFWTNKLRPVLTLDGLRPVR